MSLGGFYGDKIISSTSSCSEFQVKMFELQGDEDCQQIESKSILNFYGPNEIIEQPNCYKESGFGDGDLCGNQENIINNTWKPITE